MLLIAVLGSMLVMPATAATATRTLPDDCVNAEAEFTVTITSDDYGSAGAVTETLCDDWEYVGVTGDVGDVKIKGNNVEFLLIGSGLKTFTYTVLAPDEVGTCCQIGGTIRDYDTQDHTVTGAAKVCVCGDPPATISATREISDQTVNPGSTFTVTLTLTANEDIQSPTLDETFPAGWTVKAVDNGGATYKPPTKEWVWATAMPRGGTKTVIYDVTVPANATPQYYGITGQASANNASPVAIGGESKVTVKPGTPDPISAIRDISDQTVEAGSTFKVTLTLTAKEDIQAPVLDENLPAGWIVTEVDNGGATYKPATKEWVWATAMSDGESKTVIYDVTVPANATPSDYYITGPASANDVGPIAIGGENKVTVIILYGDVNHDGELSIVDVMITLQMAAKSTDIDFTADVNADGVVTSVDALMIWQTMIS